MINNEEDVRAAGQPTMGKAGPSVRNVSGEVKTIGTTVRTPSAMDKVASQGRCRTASR